MTEEQEAIAYFEGKMLEEGDNITITFDFIENLETVLNMLKEKDKEIEKLKQALARNIAKNFTSSMKKSAKAKEDLEMLNEGWQTELEKKDKIIDLMAEQLAGLTIWNIEKEEPLILKDKEEVKQYFERKSEE